MLVFVFSLIIAITLPLLARAQSIPPDTIAARLQRYCDQRQQYGAFIRMTERGDRMGLSPSSYPQYRVNQQFDTESVRNAFELFVRSISLVDCTANCDQVYYVYEISGRNRGHDNETSLHQVLSVYIWWGFTEDLYDIADTLYVSESSLHDSYYAMLWNQMGTGYFEHVYNRLQSDSTFIKGADIACAYLANCPEPRDSMDYWAVETVKAAAASTVYRIRFRVSESILDAYLNGHYTLKSSVDTLLNDSDEFLRDYLWSKIQRYQKRNILNEFRYEHPYVPDEE